MMIYDLFSGTIACNCTASDCQNSCSAGEFYDASGPGCTTCLAGY